MLPLHSNSRREFQRKRVKDATKKKKNWKWTQNLAGKAIEELGRAEESAAP